MGGSRSIKVPAGWVYPRGCPATTVEVASDGAVTWNGRQIGYVSKGTRLYSPPPHKGSRIVKYHHKRVPEWHGGPTPSSREIRCDSRRQVLQRLIVNALESS